MHTEFIRTDEYYHRIMAAADAADRDQLYRELIVEPWLPMMQTLAPMFQADLASDPLAVARAWAWLLPDQLTEMPDVLRQLEEADAWTIGEQAMQEAAAAFAPYADRIPVDRVEGWLIAADSGRADPITQGYTGAVDFTQPRFVGQYDTPTERNLRQMPGLFVHEMHHVIRLRLFPWDMANTSVAQYIIHEGLAESFATELYGDDMASYVVTDISATDLETARKLIGGALDATGFNVIRGYIFGDTLAPKFGFEAVGMPDYGGYAVGWHVVQAYLARTGKSVVDATLLPAEEIVVQSGYFETTHV